MLRKLLSHLLQSGSKKLVDSVTLSRTILDGMDLDFHMHQASSGIESLAMLLATDVKYVPKTGEGHRINLESFPSFLYVCDVVRESQGDDKSLHASVHNGGSAYVFASEGYFLTALHVVEHVLDTSSPGEKVILFYDPHTGLASKAQLLAYSRNYDLALCKVPTSHGMYQDVPLLKEEPVFPDLVYSPIFGDSDILLAQLRGVLQRAFGRQEDGSEESLKFGYEELKIGVSLGRVLNGFEGPNVEPVGSGTRIYGHDFWTQYVDGEPIKVGPGNSGSPVLTLDNQLVGVTSMIYGPRSPDGRIDPRLITFSGPLVIQSLLQNYVNACS
jgi:hypothetical protein